MEDNAARDGANGLERLQERLAIVLEAARLFAEMTTDYARLLDSVAETLTRRIGDGCGVFLLNESRTELRPASLRSTPSPGIAEMDQHFLAQPIQLAREPTMRHVIETGEAVLVEHLNHDARPDVTPEQAALDRSLGVHSFLVVALRARGRSLGSLALGRYLPGSPAFSRGDQELAQALADHAALAIQNAQLYVALEQARGAAQEAEERARQSEQMHRFLFESSPVATFVFDVESSRILEGNAAALQLYGYAHDEFVGLSVDALRVPEDRERLARAVHDAGTAVMHGAAQHRRKDGTPIPIEGRSHLITFQGRPARLATVQDQTQRLAAEAARREVEERLQRTLDMMLEGYTILDHDMRTLYVNEAAARHGRQPKERLLGHTPMEIYPNFEDTGVYRLIKQCLVARKPARAEQDMTLVDGERAVFELSISPIPEGVICLTIDVTERHRQIEARELLEEQLRQSQRMDAVGRLAGGIAHDFNNILSIILGYGESLLADFAPGDPKRADLTEMHRAATRAAELTKQLLMFSRQQLVEPKIIDLNEVLSAMQSMLRRVLTENIELDLRLAPELGRIRADRGNIEQVIMNLVVNARDAMPSGGKLTLATANVRLDEAFAGTHAGAVPGSYVRLSVTDTGIGMDKATRLRMFEPFFTTKGPGKGTGLGLATVFGIVQQSHGNVWVNSAPGKGSTFEVYLPRTDAEATIERVSERPATRRGSETILLVEDEEAVRSVAQRMLERAGYHVIGAHDPAEALRIAADPERSIDLLLTDVVMPQLSGAALAEQVGARRPGMRILYVSGYTDGTVGAHGVLESGASFLQKPFTSQQLIRKVRAVLDTPSPAASPAASSAGSESDRDESAGGGNLASPVERRRPPS